MTCRRPDIVCKLYFIISKLSYLINVVVPYQNLEINLTFPIPPI